MTSGLITGFRLDRQWHWLRGEMEQSKRPALLTLGRILAEEQIRYAIIGGLALQIHQKNPRTTLDIDVAIASRSEIPRAALESSGFTLTGSFPRSENWSFSDGTPVQFSDDSALRQAIANAAELHLEDITLRIIRPVDLLHEKIRAGSDPARRRSKRLQDLADAQSLLEEDPELIDQLTIEERAVLDSLPR